ncbi:histidine triad protein D [Streptococcus pneumoniae]|nr:pneumococcal-type histidine triad protein [Streptococcus pneumoniae]VFH77718.1 histidine triad protein D [Streptococcus pneumoniae]
MKINKKYLAGSVAVLALSVCSYELGRYQAGQDKKESNRVAWALTIFSLSFRKVLKTV